MSLPRKMFIELFLSHVFILICILPINATNNSFVVKSLDVKLQHACNRHKWIFSDSFEMKFLHTIKYLAETNINYVFTDGSALALERFGLLSSPWDDDIDATIPLEEYYSLLWAPVNTKLYKDISLTSLGKQADKVICRSGNHKYRCHKLRLVEILETKQDDCISIEALEWGLQIRFHELCYSIIDTKQKVFHKPVKMMDIFMTHKCSKFSANSFGCKQSEKRYARYIQRISNLRTNEYRRSKSALNFLMSASFESTNYSSSNSTSTSNVNSHPNPFNVTYIKLNSNYLNGTSVPVTSNLSKYLQFAYDKGAISNAIICGHDNYSNFGKLINL